MTKNIRERLAILEAQRGDRIDYAVQVHYTDGRTETLPDWTGVLNLMCSPKGEIESVTGDEKLKPVLDLCNVLVQDIPEGGVWNEA